MEFARQNSSDDVRPCAIISIVAPMKLHGVWIMIDAITSAMWLTEESAISDFKSVWRKQIELVIIIPHRERRMKGYAIYFVSGSRIMEMRIIP